MPRISPANSRPPFAALGKSGQLRPYVRPVRGYGVDCRWPSWVFAHVSGTNLRCVLKAQSFLRYCPNCIDLQLSHHAVQRLLPDLQPDLRPAPAAPRLMPPPQPPLRSTSRCPAGRKPRWVSSPDATPHIIMPPPQLRPASRRPADGRHRCASSAPTSHAPPCSPAQL